MSSSSNSSRHNNRHHIYSSSNRQEYEENDSLNNHGNDSNENIVHIKFLLPGTTTGSVIGKGGERIASLQKETNTKMKMSKAGDYFPGTQERVCLVVGTIASVLSVYECLSDKIKENLSSDNLRSRQIKLLIPNGTAGVIIGKGGTTIEHIKQDTTASITITPKSDMSERVMTITGEDTIRMKTLDIVLQKVLEDPHHDSIPSVYYSSNEKSSPIHSINNPPMIHDNQTFNDRNLNGKMNSLISMNASSNFPVQHSCLQRLSDLIINSGGPNNLTVDSLVRSLTSLGFHDPNIREILQAINILINYGLITIENPTRTNIYPSMGPIHSTQNFQSNYSSFERDHQDNYSRNSNDMDYKRFKSDQHRTKKAKR